MIVDASHAPGVPAPKPLTERIAQSTKSQPKPATEPKPAGAGRRSRRVSRRGGRTANRPKKKTAEELDAEMDDYFVSNESGAQPAEGNAPVNGQAQAQPATNGGEDVGMAEISVGLSHPGRSWDGWKLTYDLVNTIFLRFPVLVFYSRK